MSKKLSANQRKVASQSRAAVELPMMAAEKVSKTTDKHIGIRRHGLSIAIASALFPAASFADILVTGEVNPGTPITPEWSIPGPLIVGDAAQGTLTITNGSTVRNGDFESYVGAQAGSDGTVTLTGPGSLWEASTGSWITNIGNYGTGSLVVTDGANFKAGQLWLGRFAESSGSAVFQGNDTRAVINAEMYVGVSGNGSLALSDGAQLKGYSAQIGTEAGSSGAAVVSGVNTRWDLSNYFLIGNLGLGLLRIEDGAVVASGNTTLGSESTASGSITVSGAGSELNAQSLRVGRAGIGNMLVENGGLVTATTVSVGSMAGSSGLFEVVGPGSRLESGFSMMIGGSGLGTMKIADGGVVSNSSGHTVIGGAGSGKGFLEITDSGSRFETDSIDIGNYSGGEGSVKITNGAAMASDYAQLGSGGSSSGKVQISGSGSLWQAGTSVVVGNYSDGSVIVDDGGKLKADSVQVARMAGSDGKILVSGEGSALEASSIHLSGDFNAADGGNASLTINNGAVVRADYLNMTSGSVGTASLNIGSAMGSAATAAGTFEGNSIFMGEGSTVVFNHTGSDYQFNSKILGFGDVAVYRGTTTFNGVNTYSGDTTITEGTLQAGATGVFSSASDHFIGPLGTLALAGKSQTIASLKNGGTVSLGDLSGGVPGALLTVKGDYWGDGGVLELNTKLQGDDSQTDKLIIQGNSEGDTILKVNNIGGTGAQTDNGIQVVEVKGSSNGVFTLGNRVVAGSYEYLLSMGGKTPDGNWYLRSELNAPEPEPQPEVEPKPVDPADPVDPAEPVDPVTPVDPVDPVEPVAPGPKPTKPSLYRPEIGAYLGNQLAATSMFRHTLHERVGELDFSEAQREEGGTPGSVWMRVKRNDFTADTGAKQIDVDTTTDILQVGADLARWYDGDNRYHLGVMAGTGKANTDVDSNVLGYKAKGEVEGYSVGVYGTWYQSAAEPTGAYVDTWLQFGDYENSVKGDGLAREKYDSKTWSASVEAGYAFEVGRGEGKAYYVEPQAQVIYTDFKADKHKEQNGTVVKSKSNGDVTTRLGARAYVRPTDKSGAKVQPFVEANWWRSEGDNAMSFNDTTAQLDGAENLFEVKVGAEVDMGKGWSAFGHLGKQMSSGDQQDVAGQLGVKYSW